jgi:16S rRNA A1518/A1519 N6-dimethyltransferase RsmA/KsgA/DIM1 with predicted DNA glycosylase/AP lyase activity
VPQLTQKVLQYLDPQAEDKILDIGCGDGKFTSNYLDKVAQVYGVDASDSFIQSANKDYGSDRAKFSVVDCRYLEKDRMAVSGTWDKVYVWTIYCFPIGNCIERVCLLRCDY